MLLENKDLVFSGFGIRPVNRYASAGYQAQQVQASPGVYNWPKRIKA
jgi:hypothetical protein